MADGGGLLPPVLVELRATTADLAAKFAAAKGEISALESHSSSTLTKMSNVGRAAFLSIGTGAVAAGIVGVKLAGDFQSAMTSLVTGAGESQKNIHMVSSAVLDMAPQVGTTALELAKGLFMIESAGYHAGAGLEVARASAEGAKVGHADFMVTANAVTTVMKDYGIGANHAADATNFLISVVSQGKTHMQDLAPAMATVLPIASQLHVPLADVGGALATMTSHGIAADKAATFLRFTFGALVAPTSAAKKELQDIGLTQDELGRTLTTRGLVPALTELEDHLKSKFPEGSAEYVAALSKIVGGQRGMQGALALTGMNLNEFTADTLKTAGAMEGAHGKVLGWSNVQKDLNFQLDQGKAMAESLGIKFGDFLIPKVEAAGHAVLDVVNWFEQGSTAAHLLEGGMVALAGAFMGAFVINKTVQIAKDIGQAWDALTSGAQRLAQMLHLTGPAAEADAAAQESDAAATSSFTEALAANTAAVTANTEALGGRAVAGEAAAASMEGEAAAATASGEAATGAGVGMAGLGAAIGPVVLAGAALVGVGAALDAGLHAVGLASNAAHYSILQQGESTQQTTQQLHSYLTAVTAIPGTVPGAANSIRGLAAANDLLKETISKDPDMAMQVAQALDRAAGSSHHFTDELQNNAHWLEYQRDKATAMMAVGLQLAQAQDQVASAGQNLNQVLMTQPGDLQATAAAQHDLEGAIVSEMGAVKANVDAQNLHVSGSQRVRLEADAQRQTLMQLAQQFPNLNSWIQSYIGNLGGIPPAKNTNLTAADYASGAINALIGAHIPDKTVNITANISAALQAIRGVLGFQHGGTVPNLFGSKNPVPALVHPGEVIINPGEPDNGVAALLASGVLEKATDLPPIASGVGGGGGAPVVGGPGAGGGTTIVNNYFNVKVDVPMNAHAIDVVRELDEFYREAERRGYQPTYRQPSLQPGR